MYGTHKNGLWERMEAVNSLSGAKMGVAKRSLRLILLCNPNPLDPNRGGSSTSDR